VIINYAAAAKRSAAQDAMWIFTLSQHDMWKAEFVELHV